MQLQEMKLLASTPFGRGKSARLGRFQTETYGHADEWARLASHWEMLARIRERMPIITNRHDIERDQVPNARRA
jgi:hypothetical protein